MEILRRETQIRTVEVTREDSSRQLRMGCGGEEGKVSRHLEMKENPEKMAMEREGDTVIQ